MALTSRAPEEFEDGHEWSKYGQKPLQHKEIIRSYFKCSNVQDGLPPCPAKKTVDRKPGQTNEMRIVYLGQHNHPGRFSHPRERRATKSSRRQRAAMASASCQDVSESETSSQGSSSGPSTGGRSTPTELSHDGAPMPLALADVERDDDRRSMHFGGTKKPGHLKRKAALEAQDKRSSSRREGATPGLHLTPSTTTGDDYLRVCGQPLAADASLSSLVIPWDGNVWSEPIMSQGSRMKGCVRYRSSCVFGSESNRSSATTCPATCTVIVTPKREAVEVAFSGAHNHSWSHDPQPAAEEVSGTGSRGNGTASSGLGSISDGWRINSNHNPCSGPQVTGSVAVTIPASRTHAGTGDCLRASEKCALKEGNERSCWGSGGSFITYGPDVGSNGWVSEESCGAHRPALPELLFGKRTTEVQEPDLWDLMYTHTAAKAQWARDGRGDRQLGEAQWDAVQLSDWWLIEEQLSKKPAAETAAAAAPALGDLYQAALSHGSGNEKSGSGFGFGSPISTGTFAALTINVAASPQPSLPRSSSTSELQQLLALFHNDASWDPTQNQQASGFASGSLQLPMPTPSPATSVHHPATAITSATAADTVQSSVDLSSHPMATTNPLGGPALWSVWKESTHCTMAAAHDGRRPMDGQATLLDTVHQSCGEMFLHEDARAPWNVVGTATETHGDKEIVRPFLPTSYGAFDKSDTLEAIVASAPFVSAAAAALQQQHS